MEIKKKKKKMQQQQLSSTRKHHIQQLGKEMRDQEKGSRQKAEKEKKKKKEDKFAALSVLGFGKKVEKRIINGQNIDDLSVLGYECERNGERKREVGEV